MGGERKENRGVGGRVSSQQQRGAALARPWHRGVTAAREQPRPHAPGRREPPACPFGLLLFVVGSCCPATLRLRLRLRRAAPVPVWRGERRLRQPRAARAEGDGVDGF